MKDEKSYPYKLDFGVHWPDPSAPGGYRSLPIWVYDKVPDGMVRVKSLKELWYGRPYLFTCLLNPGEYMTSYMRDSELEAVKYYLENDIPIYVKPNK